MIHPPADLMQAPIGSRLAAEVADDLDALFGPAGLAVDGRGSSRARQLGMSERRSGRPGRLSNLGAVAAAGLIGLSGGVFLTHRGEASAVRSDMNEARLRFMSDVRPVATALARTIYAAPTPADVSGEAAEAHAALGQEASAAAPSGGSRAAGVREPAPPRAAGASKSSSAKPRRAPQAAARPIGEGMALASARRMSGCPGREDQRACSHKDVIKAHRGLRRAYDRAAKAGVPRATLVAARQRWDELRRYAPERPERVVSGYLALSGDLAKATNLARSEPRRYAQS